MKTIDPKKPEIRPVPNIPPSVPTPEIAPQPDKNRPETPKPEIKPSPLPAPEIKPGQKKLSRGKSK